MRGRSSIRLNVASNTTLKVSLNDLGFPLPLASLGLALARDGLPAAQPQIGSANIDVPASAGSYAAYVDAAEASGSAGSFGLRIADATQNLVDTVRDVGPAEANTAVSALEDGFDVAAAGNYTLTLTDFGLSGFFVPLKSLSLALTRDGAIVDTLGAAGSFEFAATPGHYSLAILAEPAAADGQGLLGVQVRGGPQDAVAYEDTAAVGTGFVSRTFTVSTQESVDASLSDLGLPAALKSLKLAVTRGAERVGEIVGAGKFSFTVTPGTYFVNVLATPADAVAYGTLGLRVDATPPVPTVAMTASVKSVSPGGSAQLTWSSTDATSCVASQGWSGQRDPSGSVSVGPLNAETAFALTCTGPGGSADAAVTVGVDAASQSGGGGTAGGVSLVLLGIAACLRRRRRSWFAFRTPE